jgi:thioredoxin-dependent peroxiredoxin
MAIGPLQVGDRAPKFALVNQHGTTISLSDFAGSKVIVYFYPEAGTPACTEQACDFRDNLGSFATAGFTVLGISKDSVENLSTFARDELVTFSLLSDSDLTVHKKYDAYGPKSLYGRPYIGTRRSTFVIDQKGRLLFVGYNVKAKGHAERLRKLFAAA